MESRTQDIARQSIIIASATFMLIAAAVGSGAFGGTSVSELQDGALSAQGSYPVSYTHLTLPTNREV